ncbi:hypothetical protein CYMTET_46690 [Cymbomonas tetramitiformis]|uniref:Uncharacterized protein n=1 Tax=Cymbomonas tetramitiformis TaxID=36881 RepID=A0AAE0EX18_9CHLO|nr:hypothetical protein CYMTET_46690 [Cymbomonas tetramitiformis]
MKYESLVLGPALSYLHDVVAECNDALDEAEGGDLPVYQAADGVVADQVLQQWLNDFDKSRGVAMLSTTSKSAAIADARGAKDHRDQRWRERKKYDDDKDGKNGKGKGGKGRGAKPAADGQCAYRNPGQHNSPLRVLVGGSSPCNSRWLNQWCLKNRVKMETLKKLRRLAKPNEWCFNFDLKDDKDGENIEVGGNDKKNKRGGAVKNFLAYSLCERWKSELGQSRLTDLAVEMQKKALLDTTLDNYGPKAERFINFCVNNQRPWLPATEMQQQQQWYPQQQQWLQQQQQIPAVTAATVAAVVAAATTAAVSTAADSAATAGTDDDAVSWRRRHHAAAVVHQRQRCPLSDPVQGASSSAAAIGQPLANDPQ